MAVSRIAEMSETVDGSFYLVVEFRHAPTDPDPYLDELRKRAEQRRRR